MARIAGNGVPLDAWDLHKPPDRVACKAEMVLHGDLGGVADLAETHFKKLAERRGGHGAGRADLRLAAALRAGDGGVRLDEIADHAARGQSAEDRLIGEARAPPAYKGAPRA